MERIIIGILIINIIASLVYAVSTVSKGQKAALTFFFCTLPLLGFCIYFIPQWILRIQGKGYYDRYRQDCAHLSAVGLAFQCQLWEGILPAEDHDQKLDKVITQKQVYDFS